MSTGILVTTFEPFGGRHENRTRALGARLASRGVTTHELPVDFARLAQLVPALVRSHAAGGGRVLLMLGEASGAAQLEVEHVALNVIAARIADNAGAQPGHEELLAGAPLALAATLDGARLLARLAAANVPARASHHAGTYACNAALFHALAAAAERPQLAVGFVHVPAEVRLGEPSDDLVAGALADILLTWADG